MIYAKTGMTKMPEKSDWCPLTEIDETLPAQLAAAEMRIKRLDRLIDTKEDKHAI